MDKDSFITTNKPIPITIELVATQDGGIHTPITPEDNWRPDMYIATNNRQFWGEIKINTIVKPGEKNQGNLYATYPSDLATYFTKGAVINLVLGSSLVGNAMIL